MVYIVVFQGVWCCKLHMSTYTCIGTSGYFKYFIYMYHACTACTHVLCTEIKVMYCSITISHSLEAIWAIWLIDAIPSHDLDHTHI